MHGIGVSGCRIFRGALNYYTENKWQNRYIEAYCRKQEVFV